MEVGHYIIRAFWRASQQTPFNNTRIRINSRTQIFFGRIRIVRAAINRAHTVYGQIGHDILGKFKPVRSLLCAFPQHIVCARVRIIPYIPYRTVPYINWSKVTLYGTHIPYCIRYGTPCGTVYRIPKFGPLYIGSVYRKFWTK